MTTGTTATTATGQRDIMSSPPPPIISHCLSALSVVLGLQFLASHQHSDNGHCGRHRRQATLTLAGGGGGDGCLDEYKHSAITIIVPAFSSSSPTATKAASVTSSSTSVATVLMANSSSCSSSTGFWGRRSRRSNATSNNKKEKPAEWNEDMDLKNYMNLDNNSLRYLTRHDSNGVGWHYKELLPCACWWPPLGMLAPLNYVVGNVVASGSGGCGEIQHCRCRRP